MSEPSAAPVSLERARLLLGWLRAQRAVDSCLSELLAAGPAGERRVSREIDRVTGLVSAATAAFEAYSASVRESSDTGDYAVTDDAASKVADNVTDLRSVALDARTPLSR